MRLLLLVVVAVAAASAVASAGLIEILNAERGFRETWTALEFRNSVGGATVRCAVTLEGSFNLLAIEKVAGTNIGSITRASLGGCTGGTATVLTEGLPWELTYDSFTGTLPNIASIRERVLGAAIQVRNELATCLARSEARNPLYVIAATTREAGGLLETPTLRVEEGQSLPLTGAFGCELGTGRLAGSATTTVLNGTTRLTVRQVEQVPTVTLTPALVNILAGQTIAEQKFIIRNTTPVNGARIRIHSIGLSDAVRFRVEDVAGACTGRVLLAQANCQFEVNYNALYEAARPITSGVNIGWERAAPPQVSSRAN